MEEYIPELLSTNGGIQCAFCKQPATKICASCKLVGYCSPEHQRSHWEEHVNECLPYKILMSEVFGRYAVAVRDLQPGEVVLRERPVAFGPKHYTPPVCLGCLTPIASSRGMRCCSSCEWPICSEECEKMACHAENECPIFAAAKIRFMWSPTCAGEADDEGCIRISDNPMLQCITPLRLLLVQRKDTQRWNEEVLPMEAHMGKRKGTHTWRSDLVNVSGFLRRACNLADRFSDDDIMWACGILQVNAFEARSGKGGSAQCVYPRLAIFSHSCVPNITHSIDSQFNMVGRAAVAIGRGQPLNTCYTHTLSPTMERREFLRMSKFFDCDCKRCSDPTELGTNSGTMLCKTCGDYYHGELRSTNPLDPIAAWKCNECGDERNSMSVEMLLESLAARLQGTKIRNEACGPQSDECIELEETMRCCSTVLHSNHSMLTGLRVSLCQLYGNTPKLKLTDFLPLMLEHKVQLCKDILTVADVIEPGLTRLRGTTLYELSKANLQLAQKKHSNGEINKQELHDQLTQVAALLEEAVSILSLEESDSIEAKMGLRAKEELNELKSCISEDESKAFPQNTQMEESRSKLKQVFADFKSETTPPENELLIMKDRDKEDFKAFVEEICNQRDVTTGDAPPAGALPDLANIILSLQSERRNVLMENNAIDELEAFKNMADEIQNAGDTNSL